MGFPSLPVYLDPSNWNQKQAQDNIGGGGDDSHQILPPTGAAPTSGQAIRSVSMSERARLMKIPQPETAPKCPRCDSANTKFCYFNNYSLSQPRHFCKTCRRYWTRGGALRNVPVGGGCRRNKRSKPKSAAASIGGPSSSNSSTISSGGAIQTNSISNPPSQLSLISPLQTLMDYNAPNSGVVFGGIHPIEMVDTYNHASRMNGLDQWRLQPLQQFPNFMCGGGGGLNVAMPELYPLDGDGDLNNGLGFSEAAAAQKLMSSSGLISQLASVKMEETSSQGFSLNYNSRQYFGASGFNDDQHYWSGGGSSSGGGWLPDLPCFNSSTSRNGL